MLWVVKTTLVPACARAAMKRQSRSRWRGSSDAEGSSSSGTAGAASSPMAMLTRWRLPPESRPTCSFARSASPSARAFRRPRLSVVDASRAGRTGAGSRAPTASSTRAGLLRHPADALPGGRDDLARAWRRSAGEQRQQRRLAGPVRADHRPDLAGLEPRSSTSRSAATVAEVLRQRARLERRGAHQGGGGACARHGSSTTWRRR